MSRKHYYHPVKEVISDADRKMLSQKFFDFQRTLAPSDDNAFKDDILMEGLFRDFNLEGKMLLDDFKAAYLDTGDRQGYLQEIGCPARFHRVFDHAALYEDEELVSCLTHLVETYGTTPLNGKPEAVFLHTYGKDNVLPRHIDPGDIGKLTIPLYPDYDSYRNLNFYESIDEKVQPDPSHTVNYSELRSPVLLNPAKIHEIPDSVSEESLCIQLIFYQGYENAANYLSKKGLLM